MKRIILHLVGIILLLPCVLLLNDSQDLSINFFGLCWLLLLYVLAHTKLGKWFIKELEQIYNIHED
jgi:hypothetical protein